MLVIEVNDRSWKRGKEKVDILLNLTYEKPLQKGVKKHEGHNGSHP